MKSYHLVIFDFDGTLVDTLQDIAYYANLVLREFGSMDRSPDDVKKAIGWGVRELFSNLSPELGRDPGRLEEAVARFRKYYNENPVRATRPMPGVREALAGPLEDVKKAIITNKPQDVTKSILKQLKLEAYFDPVIGMHGSYPPKPDPASTFFTMQFHGVVPNETVLIGDSRVDFETARAAGVDFIWMTNGYDDSLKGERAVTRFPSAWGWGNIFSTGHEGV
jgi:phosphoglycolate phosphatase